MKPYHKIQSVFKRDMDAPKCPFIIGKYATPYIEYLKDNIWKWDEKIDGTNIRVGWEMESSYRVLQFKGRTDKADIPKPLLIKLTELFVYEQMKKLFPDVTNLCLYGEGYGAKIQKGGGNYIRDGVSFCLFDVYIDGWWLKKVDVEDIGKKLGLRTAPEIGEGTIDEGIEFVKAGFNSTWGDFAAEGIVLRPACILFDRKGDRIITKLKTKDFK